MAVKPLVAGLKTIAVGQQMVLWSYSWGESRSVEMRSLVDRRKPIQMPVAPVRRTEEPVHGLEDTG